MTGLEIRSQWSLLVVIDDALQHHRMVPCPDHQLTPEPVITGKLPGDLVRREQVIEFDGFRASGEALVLLVLRNLSGAGNFDLCFAKPPRKVLAARPFILRATTRMKGRSTLF